MIFTIASREFRNLFISPLAWVILAVVQFILAWIFLSSIEVFFSLQQDLAAMPNAPGVTDLVVAPMLQSAGIILLMVIPLLSMRLISEERRSGTLSLLQSSPISMIDIVLGKYLGLLGFVFITVALISLMPLSLYLGTNLDSGKLLAGIIGLFLLLAAFSAAGLYMSSLTDNPMIAAMSSFGLLLLLWIFNMSATQMEGMTESALTHLSIQHHFNSLLRGLIDSTSVVYFLLFIVFFIVMTIKQLESQRVQA